MLRYVSLILPIPIAKNPPPRLTQEEPTLQSSHCYVPKGSVRKLKSEHMDLESKTSPNLTLAVSKIFYLSNPTAKHGKSFASFAGHRDTHF